MDDMTVTERLARELKAEKYRNGLKNDEISQRTGLSEYQVQRRLAGAPVDIEELFRFASAFNVTAQDLVSRVEPHAA